MMINDKKMLKEYLVYEKGLYFKNKFEYLKSYIYKNNDYNIWKYVKFNRKMEYYFNKKNVSSGIKKIFFSIKYILLKRKLNKLGLKTGFEIYINTVKKGLKIYHYGNVIINGSANIGENIQIHGDCCIGNKGREYENFAPTIGNDVDIGINAVILGDIKIGNNIKIGAGSVVTKSFLDDNSIIVGVPAEVIKK